MAPTFSDVVCRITFPYGKIRGGKDIGGHGHSTRYFGSWDHAAIERDFSNNDMSSLTLHQDILFESARKSKVTRRESQLIREMQSSDPEVG